MSAEAYGQIVSNLEGITGQAEGSFTTGGFKFTESELRDLITEFTELAEDYEDSADSINWMRNIQGPGLDFVSQSYADTANAHGEAYRQQAELLQKTLDEYLGLDSASAEKMNKPGDDGGVL